MTDSNQPVEGDDTFRLLFVCTGNTCRSPMAEAIARRRAEEEGWTRLEVRSAGAAAAPGAPASDGARRAAEQGGASVDGHKSKPLSPELVRWADLILTMAPHHVLAVLEHGGDGKVSLLRDFATEGEDQRPVSDPIGGDDEVYEETYRELRELVERTLARVQPMISP